MNAGRNVLTAALLGLPAALLAHALIFGGRHEAGGALHSAAMACAAFALILLIAPLRRCVMPRLAGVFLSAGGWFAALELCEAPHAIPIVLAAIALLAASVLARMGVQLLVRSLEAIEKAIDSVFECRRPVRSVRIRFSLPRATRAQQVAYARRRFCRPPPALS